MTKFELILKDGNQFVVESGELKSLIEIGVVSLEVRADRRYLIRELAKIYDGR